MTHYEVMLDPQHVAYFEADHYTVRDDGRLLVYDYIPPQDEKATGELTVKLEANERGWRWIRTIRPEIEEA